MKREDIENLKNQVGCAAVLETAGFALDAKESTLRAAKFRRGSDIIIVTHEGRGWFDPLSEGKGDVFSLVSRLNHVGFAEGLERIAALIGFQRRPQSGAELSSNARRVSALPSAGNTADALGENQQHGNISAARDVFLLALFSAPSTKASFAKALTAAWARLFSKPLVLSFNT